MSCPNFTERIALYAGGDLPAAEAAAIERHLRDCPACARLARELADDRRALQRLAPVAPDSAALAARRAAVLAQLNANSRAPRRGFDRRILAVAALVVAVLGLVAIWSLRQTGVPDGMPAPSPVQARTIPSDTAPEPRLVPPLPSKPPPAPARPANLSAPEASDAEPVRRADATLAHPPIPEPAASELPSSEPTTSGPTRQAATTAPTPSNPLEPPPPAAPELAAEPMLIQLVSDDPDLVIYWLVDPEENPDEHTAATAD